jgi:hypothetical protein
MNAKQFAIVSILLASVCAFATGLPQNNAPVQAKPQESKVLNQSKGERLFKQECSRCHTAPEGFSPRISGTIVRHMRVRASLSQQQEEELLRFFNP